MSVVFGFWGGGWWIGGMDGCLKLSSVVGWTWMSPLNTIVLALWKMK